jgi:hypothetical protein
MAARRVVGLELGQLPFQITDIPEQHLVAGRDRPRRGSLCGASPAVPFETVASPSRHGTLYPSPHSEPGVQISRTGLARSHLRSRSDGRMTGCRVREFEPCAA